jgi:hypothetical protein
VGAFIGAVGGGWKLQSHSQIPLTDRIFPGSTRHLEIHTKVAETVISTAPTPRRSNSPEFGEITIACGIFEAIVGIFYASTEHLAASAISMWKRNAARPFSREFG